MLLFLLLSFMLHWSIIVEVSPGSPEQECFNTAATKYITCIPVNGRPAACDCTEKKTCYIKMIVSKRNGSETPEYLVNQTLQGPTIIVMQYNFVIVDFANEMDENTSIHFHGMKQEDNNWADGTGDITQHPIPAYGKFRYMFQADPQGTHFYHSHMRFQRDTGLFGALIVVETQRNIHERLGPFEDQPARKTMAVLERRNTSIPITDNWVCMPDGSNLPLHFYPVSWLVNGKTPPANIFSPSTTNDGHAVFHVVGGKNFRFRIIAATYGALFMMSIDYHKMHIMATDGYLVKPFETDFLIMHSGERYDFLLKAKKGMPPGSRFPVRIQALGRNCTNHSQLLGENFAFLVYKSNEFEQEGQAYTENLMIQNDRCHNKSAPCTVLNCPCRKLPIDYPKTYTYTKCYNILSLELLYPTPYSEIPVSVESTNELFFNFHSLWFGPSMVNGVVFKDPEVPFLLSNNHSNECRYPVKCEQAGKTVCPHSVHINEFGKPTRFVLSSINEQNKIEPNVTHPIHIHGRQYFIAKIGYPEYHKDGNLKAQNKDLKMSKCGPAEWRNGPPKDISVTRTTVRKDTVIIPTGGYVVVDFIQDNPGYWYLHCHMSWHLNKGMSIVVAQNIHNVKTPPIMLHSKGKDVCFPLETFLHISNAVRPNIPPNTGK